MSKTALLMVDLQNDFCNGGTLAVENGDDVIPLANQLQPHFDYVVATRDWHPKNHISFAANHPGHKVGDTIFVNHFPQTLWPVHGVQHSPGADMHKDLDIAGIQHYVFKGTDTEIDSYSAFYDNHHHRSTDLENFLEHYKVKDIYIMGLATDYCVKYSCLDALKLGFNVYVITDACRGVEKADVEIALDTMQKAGAKFIQVSDIVNK
ncbi:MAG: bifunctional nicotinamidase/pyrazinamidase [Gammaproteobacteria bacterium]|nr:bifunctional nicotinamidase/pyrazinamidase [Gammaproteobacteria bacterium]